MKMLKIVRSFVLPLLLWLSADQAFAHGPGSAPSAKEVAVATMSSFHHRRHDESRSGDSGDSGDDTGNGEASPDDDAIVSFGGDAHLPAGRSAGSVVAIFASALSEGAAGDVVSIFGSTRVTGPSTGDAVALLGDNYVDSKVDGDAVAVLGNLELGPHAEIGGDVVTVGGTLTRDPQAIVHGHSQSVLVSSISPHFDGLRTWARECLKYGRPLAFAPGLGWAWALALSLLAVYALLALLFPGVILHCTRTLEAQPGHTLLAAIVGSALTPLLLGVLCITVVGIAAVPFLIISVLAISLLGKAVMLAWLGQRCIAWRVDKGPVPPALLVIIGGAIALLLYVIPVIGLIVYKLLGLMGFGVIVLAVLQNLRSRRPDAVAATASPPVAPTATLEVPGGSESAAPQPGVTGAAASAASAASAAGDPGGSVRQSAAGVASASIATLPRAGFWIRMAALLIDIILVGILLSILHHMAHLEVLALATYGAVMWKVRGSTIGGIVFDLQVLRHDGRPMDWTTAIVRALGCLLSMVPAGLGFLWIAFDREKQAWHDKIAGTVVVRTSRRISLV
jgi:uncharacterized RDD family membrane protein YckC